MFVWGLVNLTSHIQDEIAARTEVSDNRAYTLQLYVSIPRLLKMIEKFRFL